MIYLDSSALFKLIREEAETPALVAWLDRHLQQPVVTSELGRIEVVRAARRVDERTWAQAHAVVDDLDLVPLSRTVQDTACAVGDPLLRTLDALHLASALRLGDAVTAFVAYDHGLIDAARTVGMTVVTPGRLDPSP